MSRGAVKGSQNWSYMFFKGHSSVLNFLQSKLVLTDIHKSNRGNKNLNYFFPGWKVDCGDHSQLEKKLDLTAAAVCLSNLRIVRKNTF